MNLKLLPIIAVAAFCCGTLSSKDLTSEESADLLQEIEEMFAAFENGDATSLIEKTHVSIHALTGGKEGLERITKEAIEQIRNAGVKFLESELGKPTGTHPAGNEEVCFVPRISIMEVDGKRAKSTGFMIAIRPMGGGPWSFLDGGGLRQDPEFLWRLFPDLDRNIELPPNFAEPL